MVDENRLVHPMQHFKATHFLFVCEATQLIQLDAQPGTAIRGALYHALINLFSPKEPIPGVPLDPVRALLAEEDESNPRGRDIPRAFAVEPPAAYLQVEPRRRFQFGVSLFGAAEVMMPYLFRAVPQMGHQGIGRGRGQFRLVRIDEFLPLNDSRRVVMHHQRVVEPRLTVTHRRVLEEVGMRRKDEITLRFETPMRLVENGALVHQPRLGVLLRRLVERAQALVEHYSAEGEPKPPREMWLAEWQKMSGLADALDTEGLLLDETRWVNIDSYSRARGRRTPIGGFVGQARWRIQSPEVLAWLLWGQSLHVGRNIAKGDGYFRVE
ncbi:MAG: CRISPR system precrRNA processing endoribonuclease RAMP protein Cas6 [bacterium]|nr:CRISPR system precrRNA processing endoribonuclease RAMP protein Cas6 [bacterium]